MSMPALRQPKIITEEKMAVKSYCEPHNYLIVTLKDGTKLVVASDSYHGILTAGVLYKCVFCEFEMIRDVMCKERHKTSQNHRKIMETYPHVEEFKENLIRKLDGMNYYCTVCNVVVTSQFLYKHLATDAHHKELKKATARVPAYTPDN